MDIIGRVFGDIFGARFLKASHFSTGLVKIKHFEID